MSYFGNEARITLFLQFVFSFTDFLTAPSFQEWFGRGINGMDSLSIKLVKKP